MLFIFYYAFFVLIPRKRLLKISKAITNLNSNRFSTLEILSSSFIEIKIFDKTNFLLGRLTNIGENLAKKNALVHIIGLAPKLGIEYGVVFTLLISYFMYSGLTLTDEIAFLAFLCIFRIAPLLQVIFMNTTTLRANYSALSEVVSFLNLQKTSIDNVSQYPDVIENIEFQNVQKFYRSGNNIAKKLGPWSFVLPKNGLVCIQGETGAGKSTLSKILIGVNAPDSGTIKVNGEEVDLFMRKSWFSRIAFVNQGPLLVAGSIRENLNFLLENDYTDVQLERSLKMAGLDLKRNELSLDFDVGDNGRRISGGQAQRIALARAFLSNRDILVLDEPTSALNAELEDFIITQLKEIGKNKLVIVISHSKKLFEAADLLIECRIDS